MQQTILPTKPAYFACKYFKQMDFLKSLVYYYNSEYKAGYFIGSVIAGLLLLIAFLLWKFASPFSLIKGLAIPLLIAGVFMGIGGSLSGYFTQKSYPEKVKLYQQDKHNFFKQEVAKVQRTHKSWFGIRLWWTIVAIAGLSIAVSAKKDYTIGLGLGILFFGLLGHLEEAISYHRNETYKDAVIKAAEKNKSEQQKPLSSTTTPYHKAFSENDSKISIKKYPAIVNDIIEIRPASDTLHIAYLNSTYMANHIASQLNDSLNLKVDTISNSTDLNIATNGHRKLINYYNSDLIARDRISSKNCWFNKKYIRN